MKTTSVQHIEPDVISHICDKISNGHVVNEKLPKNGILHIDKTLPFICVYRFKEPDVYFSRVIKTQASYVIVDETTDLSHLLEAIRLIMSQKFESFLILECWPKVEEANEFEVFCPAEKAPETVNALKEGFSKLRNSYPDVKIKVSNSFSRHPQGLSPLLNVEDSKKTGTLVIGIALPALYKNSETNELYALFFREFYSVFSETIKRAVYEFIRVQTTDVFDNYLMLGKTHIDQVTLQVDRDLAEISAGMSFLLRTTPVNSNEAWDSFLNSNYEIAPSFKYRLIALDPEQEKQKLYAIPIDEVNDPTLAFIFRGKRMEIGKQLTMLEERGTDNFRYVGESLYGVNKKHVLQTAKHILTTFPRQETTEVKQRINCYEFAKQAQIELDHYTKKFPESDLSLEIRNDVAGIMVSKSKLLINNNLNMDASRCDALIQHEVSTHILTYCNGQRQPLRQMCEGFEGYDQLQEGLAVLAEYLVGGLTVNRLRLLAGRVIAVESLVNRASFIETFNLLSHNYGFSDRNAYYISMRVYRGGGLTKDAVYLAGLIDLKIYLEDGGQLEPLYTGKFNITHINLIEELLYRNVLVAPILPRFLERASVKKRLKTLRKGMNITEMVN